MTANGFDLEVVKGPFTVDGVWQLRSTMAKVLKAQLGALPTPGGVSEEERRYPTTEAGLATFLDDLFTRHLIQVQNSLLQEQAIAKLHEAMEWSRVTILDIGSGPAVAALAVLDLLDVMLQILELPPISVEVALNDVSAVNLEAGERLIQSYHSRNGEPFQSITVRPLHRGFPNNLAEIRECAVAWGGFDVLLLSYVLVPLKRLLSHRAIQEALRVALDCGSSSAVGLILQDKFNESLARAVGRNLQFSTRKASVRQAVDKQKLGQEVQTYTYFETLIT